MTDRPILFSAPMVRALLAGTKTQTRRPLSRSWPVLGTRWTHKSAPWEGLDFSRAVARTRNTMAVALCGDDAWPDPHLDVPFLHPDDAARGALWQDDELWYRVRPPFEVGDRLWVKETWRTHRSWDDHKPVDIIPASRIWYEADDRDNCDQHGKVRVSIHMPRWASRLTLTVTDVRVERLQDISEADAIAEGCTPLSHPAGRSDLLWHHIAPDQWQAPTRWYRKLWDSINGPGAWDANPWVVAVSFDVREGKIDA